MKSRSDRGTFRVRIGKVTLKDGGASVHMLNRPGPRNRVEEHLRQWSGLVRESDRPPDAYAAVAFWLQPDEPGRPTYNVGYITETDRLPTTLLVEMATPYLRNDLAAQIGKWRALEELGWTWVGWDPDGDQGA